MKNAEINKKLTPDARQRLEKLGGHILGDYPMPENVKKEFDRFGMKTPDASESLTIKKGEKRKLSADEYEKYRRETLERIYKSVESLIKSDRYREADSEKQKDLLEKEIRRARARELKETKREIKQAEFVGF